MACVSEEILLSRTAPPRWCNLSLSSSLAQSEQAAPVCVQGWLKGLIFSETTAVRTVQFPTLFLMAGSPSVMEIRDFPQDTKVLRLPWNPFHFGNSL